MQIRVFAGFVQNHATPLSEIVQATPSRAQERASLFAFFFFSRAKNSLKVLPSECLARFRLALRVAGFWLLGVCVPVCERWRRSLRQSSSFSLERMQEVIKGTGDVDWL